MSGEPTAKDAERPLFIDGMEEGGMQEIGEKKDVLDQTKEKLKILKTLVSGKEADKTQKKVLEETVKNLLDIMIDTDGKLPQEIAEEFKNTLDPKERAVVINALIETSKDDELDKDLQALATEVGGDIPRSSSMADKIIHMVDSNIGKMLASERGKGLIEKYKKQFDLGDNMDVIQASIKNYLVDLIASVLESIGAEKALGLTGELRWKTALDQVGEEDKNYLKRDGNEALVKTAWLKLYKAWAILKNTTLKNPGGTFNQAAPTISEAISEIHKPTAAPAPKPAETPVAKPIEIEDKYTKVKAGAAEFDIKHSKVNTFEFKRGTERYTLAAKINPDKNFIKNIAIQPRETGSTVDKLEITVSIDGKSEPKIVNADQLATALSTDEAKNIAIGTTNFIFTKIPE